MRLLLSAKSTVKYHLKKKIDKITTVFRQRQRPTFQDLHVDISTFGKLFGFESNVSWHISDVVCIPHDTRLYRSIDVWITFLSLLIKFSDSSFAATEILGLSPTSLPPRKSLRYVATCSNFRKLDNYSTTWPPRSFPLSEKESNWVQGYND